MTEAKRYTKKPVTINAIQFFVSEHQMDTQKMEAVGPVTAWMKGLGNQGIKLVNTPALPVNGTITLALTYAPVIDTLEGPLYVTNGDWIIQGVQGEFYPCKPDIFEQTYSEAV